MKIISWNVHYEFSEVKYLSVINESPDVLIIQECTKNDFDKIKHKWETCNWYNDDLNNEKSELGIAIFSNTCSIRFTDAFNRKYRYVVPYIIKCNNIQIHLFAVWTKPGESNYYEKYVVNAIRDPLYEDIIKNNTVIIGDFNTGNTDDYDKMIKDIPSHINCAKIKNIEKRYTYYNGKEKYYVNDFCFISPDILDNYSFDYSIRDEWNNLNTKDRYHNLSDHCPIILELSEKNA